MSVDGARLAARFSLATNRLEFCGPTGADRLLRQTIADGSNASATADALLKFEALAPYLRAIGDKHGLEPLDPSVVEAYWIGNGLLDGFTREDFAQILRVFGRRGLPDALVRILIDRLPDRPIPHHMFHVAFVGVGAVSGKVETTLANMDRCRPSWARVDEVLGSTLVVRRPPLEWREGRLRVGESRSETYPRDELLIPDVRPGAIVGIHWDLPVIELNHVQEDRLRGFTERALGLALPAGLPRTR